MSSTLSHARLLARSQRHSLLAAAIVIAIGGLVITGWLFNIEGLKNFFPGLPVMKFNAALALVLAGVGLFSVKTRPRISGTAALVVLLIGLLTLGEYLFGWNPGIDQVFIQELADGGSLYPGRMSPVTAVNLCLIGSSLLCIRFGRPALAQLLAGGASVTSLASLAGYLYMAPSLYQIDVFTSIAVHTAVSFVILNTGILYAYPVHGLAAVIFTDRVGGLLSRRLLPTVIVISVLLDWLEVKGQQANLFDTSFGLALHSLSTITMLIMLILWNARSLNRVDTERSLAMDALRQANEQLELRVQERTTELTQSNDLLKEHQARSRALLNSAPDAVIIVNSDGKISIINAQTERFFGYSRDELMGQPIEMLVPAGFRKLHPSTVGSDFSEPQLDTIDVGLELHGLRKDGSRFPVEISLSQVETADGILISSAIRDITERKHAENALRENEEKLQTIFNLLPVGASLVDTDKHIVQMNVALERILDMNMQDLSAGKYLTRQYIRGDGTPLPLTELPSVMAITERQAIYDIEIGVVKEDNAIVWTSVSAAPLPGNQGTVIVTVDTTQRKQTEHEMRRLQAALDKMLEGAQIIGFDWRYIYLNDAAAQQGLYPKEELLGQTMMEKYPGIDQTPFFDVMRRCMAERVSAHMENQFTFPDHSRGWFDLSIQPMPDGLFILSTDISERKRAESELKKTNEQLQQANEDVRQFAYIVSHDLRAPLINLKGFSELLRVSVDKIGAMSKSIVPLLDEAQNQSWNTTLHEKIPTALRFINTSVERMDGFTSAMLKLSRIGHHHLSDETVSLNDLVTHILQSLDGQIEAHGIRILVEVLPDLRADRIALDQIVGNIIINAMKYLDPARPGQIRIYAERDDQTTTIHVQDNGRGIAEADYEKIFAPFRRAGRPTVEGEGMGLAYVQALVRRYQGKIWFTSTLDVGSTFSFTIPHRSGETH